jgi:flagellar basal-body rod protein FlgB
MRVGSYKMEAVERSLDGLAMRTEAIAANVANINTPGYVNQGVEFEETLREALDQQLRPQPAPGDETSITAQQAHVLLTWQPKTTQAADGAQRLDGNSTPVETQMSTLVENTIKFNAVTSALTREFQLLKTIGQAK